MKKKNLISKVLLLMLMLVGSVSASWAEDTEEILANQFGFTSNTNLSGENATLETTNFTLTFAQNESTTVPVYNSSSEEFRLYKIASDKTEGATITIAAKNSNVTFDKIVFNFSNLPTNYSFSEGSYNTGTKTWTGNATTSLTLTNTDYSGQLKIKSMTITYTTSQSSGTATTTTITPSITNTDVYVSTAAGTLSAAVTAGGNAVSGATVTWSSSNTGVATIASDGTVTLVAKGTTTITASYAGDATYQSSSDTYELTVTDSTPSDGDVLNRAITGVTNGSTSYSNWSYTGESGAVYAGNSAGGNNAIQLRTTNSNSGIVTTTSGGKVNKVTVVWNSNTQAGRTLDIYGKNTAYTAVTNLYNSSTYGTLLGSIEYDSDTEISINGDYEYIGIRSHDGALYLDQIIIKWEDSSKTETTTTITQNITNTDVYVSTAAGSLSATVTAGGNAVPGATVTWSSSDTDVATIDANGVVTLVAAGTTTITASYAGDATYQSSSATYELTVTSSEPYVQQTSIDIVLNNSFFNSTGSGNVNDASLEGSQDRVTVTINKNDGNKLYVNETHIRLYSKNTMVLTAPDGYVFTEVEFVEPSTQKSWDGENNTSDPEGYDDNEKTWTGSSNTVTVTFGGTCRIAGLNVTLAKSVNITSYKWATFSFNQALDFTYSDVKAYIVTGFVENTATITKERVYVVPANTGLLLNAEAGTYGIPVATEETEDVSENKLHAVLGGNLTVSAGTGSDDNYVLSVKNGKVVFAWIGSTSATVKDGQAYLTLVNGPKPTGNAPWLSLEGDDDTTGIVNVNRETITNNQYYTLDGRRVAEPTKGIYIINGKKVVIK